MFLIHWTLVSIKRGFNLEYVLHQINYYLNYISILCCYTFIKGYTIYIISQRWFYRTKYTITSFSLIGSYWSKIIIIIFSCNSYKNITLCVNLINSNLKSDFTLNIRKWILSKNGSPCSSRLMGACFYIIWECKSSFIVSVWIKCRMDWLIFLLLLF